jgi:hypothetical protein
MTRPTPPTTLDDVTAVARQLGPELPFTLGTIALAAAHLRPVVETVDELRDLTRKVCHLATAQGLPPGEVALTLIEQADDPPATATEAVIRRFVETAYGTIALAGALGMTEGADVEGTQLKLIETGNHALAAALLHATQGSVLDRWRPSLAVLRGDLRVFEATLKSEDDPADEPPERRN